MALGVITFFLHKFLLFTQLPKEIIVQDLLPVLLVQNVLFKNNFDIDILVIVMLMIF